MEERKMTREEREKFADNFSKDLERIINMIVDQTFYDLNCDMDRISQNLKDVVMYGCDKIKVNNAFIAHLVQFVISKTKERLNTDDCHLVMQVTDTRENVVQLF
jgi:hypothetical protein